MINLFPIKKGQTWQGDYTLEDFDEFLELLPYLYRKIDGDWEVVVIDPGLKNIRKIFALDIPSCVNLKVYADQNDIEQYKLEKPAVEVKKVSNWILFQEMFKDINIVFNPKVVQEIYRRAGPDIDNLKTALQSVIEVSDGQYVTIADVDKVLVKVRHVYATDVIKAFIGSRASAYRWSEYNKLCQELGQDYAYYASRKYIRNLLKYKNAYLTGSEIPDKYQRDIMEIDAFTIDHIYGLFCKYDSPYLFPAILHEMERRNLNVNLH